MMKTAYAEGQRDAIAKLALEMPSIGNMARGAVNAFTGSPGRLFVEGKGAFRPGGMLSKSEVWWPSTKGLTGPQKIMPWLQRAGTMAVPFQLMSAARDPNDGALSNTLGAAGAIAGQMYGFPSLGLLGGSALANAGARLGRGIGHAMGSRPLPRPQQDPYYPGYQ